MTITLRINILDFWCRLYLAIIFKKANHISVKGGSCLVSYRLETKLMLIVIEWTFLIPFFIPLRLFLSLAKPFFGVKLFWSFYK